MKTKQILFIVLLAISLLVMNIGTALAMPPLPSGFYCTVKENSANVTVGATISAWINGVKYAETTALLYGSDTVYSLDVPGDDADTPA